MLSILQDRIIQLIKSLAKSWDANNNFIYQGPYDKTIKFST